MSQNLLQIKTEDKVTFISLNRPEKRNALTPLLIKNLLEFFKKPGWSPSTCALVLSGNGKAFCSGADLTYLKDPTQFSKKDLENLFSLLQSMEECPLPLIAQAQGFAVGGGLGLLSVADVVIAEKSTFFCFSEARYGLVPSIISPFILKKIGPSWCRFFMLSTQPFSATSAYEKGLVHFVGTQKENSLFLKKLLQKFKELDPHSLLDTKKWLNELSSLPPQYTPRSLKQKALSLIHESRKKTTTKKRIQKLVLKKS